ncbi:hypothetical protein ES703_06207 [subsurface metagenome]
MAKRIVTLSIEGTTLRILGSRGDSVDVWDIVPINPNFLKNGHVADAEGLGEVIRSIMTNMRLTTGTIMCAHSAMGSTSRILNLPALEKGQLESVIQREVRREAEVSQEDSYLYWRALPLRTQHQQVFVLSIPKEPLQALMNAMAIARLRPSIIELKPLALMRAVNRRDAIIANGETNCVEIVIVLDDVPVLIRSAFLGEGVLSSDYAVGRISDELVRTISFYNDSHQDEPLDHELPIYLTGAVAGSVSFAINVATLTGRPIQPLEPPLSYSAELPLAHYMVNMGLVLRTS